MGTMDDEPGRQSAWWVTSSLHSPLAHAHAKLCHPQFLWHTVLEMKQHKAVVKTPVA
jgi:hypothetical protein